MTINGDWPTYRYDNRLSGRSPVRGEIKQPKIVWKHFVGLWEGLIEIESAEGEDTIDLPKDKVIEPDFIKIHGAEYGFDQLIDLLGKGELTTYRPAILQEGSPIYITRRVAKLLSDIKGLQIVAFESAFQGSKVQRGYLYSYEEGVEKLVWRTEPEVDMYNPLIVIADVDFDGLPEVAVATHYRIMVYNGQTGEKKKEFKYHDMRNYGFFEAVDIDGDGFLEFIIIADFITHIEVIDNEGKDLKVLWRKDLETNLTCKRKALKVGPYPVIDIDGDGRLEIIFIQ